MMVLDSMGHLYSTESMEELYDFAVRKLGLNPAWNHYSWHFPHFDLTTHNMRQKAIRLGAEYVEAREDIVRHKKVREVFKQFYEENKHLKYWYKSKGLAGQDILRVKFSKLGIF